MNARISTPCFVALALLFAPALGGCAGKKKTVLHAQAVTGSGVRVSPSDVFSNGNVRGRQKNRRVEFHIQN